VSGHGDEPRTGAAALAQHRTYRIAVLAGQIDVAEDNVGLEVARGFHSFFAVVRHRDVKSAFTQQTAQTLGNLVIVFDDEDSDFVLSLHGWFHLSHALSRCARRSRYRRVRVGGVASRVKRRALPNYRQYPSVKLT
jgi:hypothetical protein